MKFIGITGGIGAGKSEILRYIGRHYKCEIYLADEVAHLVKRSGTECFQKLVALCGRKIVGADGEIDKTALADRIFADPVLLDGVNAIVHPAVQDFLLRKYEEARENNEVELFFVEAALLIETGYGRYVDEMWYVYADRSVRKKRLSESRGYSLKKIENIMEKQLSEEEFRRNCDFVIDNSKDLESAFRAIDKRLEAYTWLE